MNHLRLTVIVCLALLWIGVLPVAARQDESGLLPITPANAANIQQVARLGYGSDTWDFAQAPDGGLTFAVSGGVLFYQPDLSQPPRFIADTTEGAALVSNVAYLASGELVYVANSDLVVIDPASGKELARHRTDNLLFDLALNPDGTQIAYGGYQGNNGLWDWRADTVQDLGAPGDVNGLDYDPAGNLLMGGEGFVAWRYNTGQVETVLEGDADIHDVAAFPADTHHFAYASQAVASLIRIDKSLLNNDIFREDFAIDGTPANVTTFNSDATLVVEGWGNGVVVMRRVEDGETLHLWNKDTTASILEAGFIDNDTLVVALDRDGFLHAWDSKSGEKRFAYPVTSGELTALAAAPNNQWVVTSGNTGMIYWYNLVTGAELAHRPDGRINNQIAVSLDQTLMATGGEGDFSLHIYDLNTLGEPRLLSGHTGKIYSLTMTRSGSLLVSASDDGTVRGWDTATGKTLYEIKDLPGIPTSVVIGSNDLTLMVTVADNKSRVYQVDTGEFLSEADLTVPFPSTVIFTEKMDRVALVGKADWFSTNLNVDSAPKPAPGYTALRGANAAFTPDGGVLAANFPYAQSNSALFVLLNMQDGSGAELRKFTGARVNSLVFNEAGDRLLTITERGYIDVYGVPGELGG